MCDISDLTQTLPFRNWYENRQNEGDHYSCKTGGKQKEGDYYRSRTGGEKVRLVVIFTTQTPEGNCQTAVDHYQRN